MFQPGNYTGVSVNAQVKANKVVIAVPQSIIITADVAKASPIKDVLKKYDIFTDEDDSDTEFNVLAMFILYEKMKSKERVTQNRNRSTIPI